MLKRLAHSVQRLNWPISRKLLFAFTFILILFLINSSIIFTIQLRVNSLDAEEIQKLQLVQQLADLRRTIKSQNDLYSEAIFVSDATAADDEGRSPSAGAGVSKRTITDNYGGDIADALRQLQTNKALLGPTGVQLLNTLSSSYRQVLTNLGILNDLIRQGAMGKAREGWPTYADLFKTALADLENLYRQQNQERDQKSQNKSDLIQLSLLVIAASSFIGLSFTLLMALLFTQCLGQPLRQIQNYLDEVVRGNLSGSVKIENKDELGRLAQVLNSTIANLRQVLEGVRVSENLKELAESLSSSSNQQATGSNEQLGAAEQIISSMQELTQRSQEISQNAARVADTSDQTSERMGDLKVVAGRAGNMVEEVQQVVSSTVNEVALVNTTVTSLLQELVSLSERAQQIGQVIDIIGGIAEEVHLLALNAAIEAAGAGQAGERFRVVAGEIKNLANRTKESAAQITNLIRQVQQATSQTKERAEQTTSIAQGVVHNNQRLEIVVEDMQAIISQTIAVATEVFEAAHQVDNQVEAIKFATQEQMNASLQVNEALHRIGYMAQVNVVSSRNIAASTSKLDDISARLVTMLAGISLN